MDHRRRRNTVGLGIVVAVVIAVFVGVAVWELGYECVRWETRTHFKDYAERPVRFCAEYRPRWRGRDR